MRDLLRSEESHQLAGREVVGPQDDQVSSSSDPTVVILDVEDSEEDSSKRFLLTSKLNNIRAEMG